MFSQLFANPESVAYTAMIYSLVIFLGAALGRVRFFGITLGVAAVLFSGIVISYLGFMVNASVAHFVRELGLILFVYGIGLQVGPGFFASFQREGIKLNAFMLMVIALDIVVVLGFFFLGDTDLPTLVGIMQGAVTNTPGLGAAQQTLGSLGDNGSLAIQMAAGYAAAYPGGIIGLIAAMFMIKLMFNMNIAAENRLTVRRQRAGMASVTSLALEVDNPMLEGKTLSVIRQTLPINVAISRVRRGNEVLLADDEMPIHGGDILFAIVQDDDAERLKTLVGRQVSRSVFNESHHTAAHPADITALRINVTQSAVCGKKLSALSVRERYGVNISRVRRAGLEFVPNRDTRLQFGDSLTIIGDAAHIKRAISAFGNSKKQLEAPHLAELFFGIALGILLGSIPIAIPGIPEPLKLGLAGGPLIVAILISRYGGRFSVTHYVSQSANLMVREMGLALFLASVGLSVGPAFFDAIVNGDGVHWMLIGIVITFVPVMMTGIAARWLGKLTYPEICGVLTGAHTCSPLLPFSAEVSQSEQTALKYVTVYPLATFLRIMAGQTLIILLWTGL